MEGMLRENTSVHHSQEKIPEQSADLPNPELNPLINPTLGRHLGRWAQVYFTSPPEKREKAIEELLRELQEHPVAEQTDSSGPDAAETIRIIEDAHPPTPATRCPQCGHRSAYAQRFCGMCGAPFSQEEPATHRVLATESVSHAPAFSDRAFLAGDAGDPQPSSERLDNDAFADVSWLREKSVSNQTGSWSKRSRRYVPALVAVLAIGILFYAQSRPQDASSRLTISTHATQGGSKETPPQVPAESSSAAESPQAAVPSLAPPTAPPGEAKPKEQAQVPGAGDAVLDTQPKTAESRPWKAPAAAAPQMTTASSSPTTNGSLEVAQAEEWLSGRVRPRDSAQAAQWLWRAVAKENPTAILMLSDLYRVGDGVPRSCDQARLLLTAAARKSVPQAAEKLRDLLRTGCSN